MGINKLNLKIIAATSMCIFSLFALFSGTIAWFNVTQAATDNANNMGVAKTTSALKKITFHAQVGTKSVTEGETTTSYYLFEKAEYASITVSDNVASALSFNTDSGAYKDWDEKDDKTATLATYSLLAQDHPILMLFELESYTASDPRSIVLDFTTSSTYLGSKERGQVTNNNNPLSSVVQFASFGLTADLPSGGAYTSSTQTYSETYLYGEVRGITYDKKWVSISDEEEPVIDDDGKINIFSNLDQNGDPSSTVYAKIGVVMNYNIDSLEYIYNKFLGETVLDSSLYFDWDWTMEM
ncbi:MAG: hypothetical protein K6F32_02600 [Bacilli bacterium]|nr:hypothetical protein [Bacilli bacterium]